MKLNCLIVDDEPVARKGLAEDVQEIPYLNIAGTAGNVFEALEVMNTMTVDLIFLDIEMPKLNGMDFLKLIKVKPMVIITTAYHEYALEGYEHGVVDYLLKPIAFDRLKSACERALEIHQYRHPLPGELTSPDFIFIKCNGVMEKILLDDIIYIEAANNYIFVHTSLKRYITYLTLKGIEAQLPKDAFVKVHKSFIVARKQINQVKANKIVVNNVPVPLSRSFRSNFQKQVIHTQSLQR